MKKTPDSENSEQKKSSHGIIHKTRAYSSNLMMFFSGPPEKPENENETMYSIQLGRFKQTIIGDAQHGLPYGLAPRLIKIWIDTEVIYSSKGRGNIEEIYSVIKGKQVLTGFKLTLPKTLTAFLTDSLGLSKGSIDIRELQDQMVRMANVKFRTTYLEENGDKTENTYSFINNSQFTWQNDELKESFFYIDPNYYRDIVDKRHWMILEMDIVKRFLRNIEGLDLYRFCKHTCCTLRVLSKNIYMDELQLQLDDKSATDNFVKKVKKIIEVINKDRLVSAEVVTKMGKGVKSYLKLNSTKNLIKYEKDDVIDNNTDEEAHKPDASVSWLNNQLIKSQQRLDEVMELESSKKNLAEIGKLKKQIADITAKIKQIG